MSIPEVNFSKRQRSRQLRTREISHNDKPVTPIQHKQSNFQSPQKKLSKSSVYQSESSDDSDEIPVIQSTRVKHDFREFSENDSSSISSDILLTAGSDWSSHKRDDGIAKDEIGYPVEPTEKTIRKRPSRGGKVRTRRTNTEEQVASYQITKLDNQEFDRHEETKTTESEVIDKTEKQCDTKIDLKDDIYLFKPDQNEYKTYVVIREKGKMGIVNFLLTQNEKTILVATNENDVKGEKQFIIGTQLCSSHNSPLFKGFLRVQERGHRFTLVSNIRKPNDDRDGELFGVYFKKGPEGRKMRLVTNIGQKPHFPISKRLNLSRVAREKEELKRFKYYSTEQNSLDNFGTDLVKPSVKNFILHESGVVIFQIFRMSKDTFNVKCKMPFDDLMCFGLAISIIFSQ